MKLKIIVITLCLSVSATAASQSATAINQKDPQGRKQGHWIKRNADENIIYDGFFVNDHPVGEFKRYDENGRLKSFLTYSNDGNEALVVMYHPNGFIASRGIYINQKKEGKWQFFSEYSEGYLIAEEQYTGNIRNGPSLKFYPDSTIAERITYVNDIKQGEWIKYYPDGNICLKSSYRNDKVEGRFEAWFDNSQIQFSGQYRNNARDGVWYIYNKDGTIKYQLEYIDGVAQNRQMYIDESDYIDSLEQNQGKIADPEKTGIIIK